MVELVAELPLVDVTVIGPVVEPGIMNTVAELSLFAIIICGTPPIVTDCRQAKLTPVILTIVPGCPDAGLKEVTDGVTWNEVDPQVLVTLTD